MSNEFEMTSLWLSSLADQPDQHNPARQRLRVEYASLRCRVGVLLEKIQADFPDLTLHDLTHIDGLWAVGSLIAGDRYPINALEAFVLGGAFLLHDAALCFEAYEGGREGVRNTVTWKDAFAAAKLRSKTSNIEGLEQAADFAAVRKLHAQQARNLAEQSWKSSPDGQAKFLIVDEHIRNHYGELMGEIAASHHLDIERVEKTMKIPFNPSAEFPREWTVDRMKLAFLLRCSDALHIDGSRAPDFLHALRQRSGISHSHWQAQNWLGSATLDLTCKLQETALVTSTKTFPKSEAASWWVAYDGLCVASKEIVESNVRLRDSDRAQFKIRRVRGTDSPESMAEIVRTVGWNPCSASIHVANVEQLVRELGGDKLYGPQCELGVALRELIQNARDAICARRELELETNFTGRICIDYCPDTQTVTIEDDGIGMSQHVLIGPLLSFGTSFWSTDLVQEEFPGLISSSFQSSGRFGIGFFSVFMAACSVTVSSRRHDSSYDETTTIEFPDGLSLRPVLSVGRVANFRQSTRVTLKLHQWLLKDSNDLMSGRGFVEGGLGDGPLSMWRISLAQYLGALCAALNVHVYFSVQGKQARAIHLGIPTDSEHYEAWLRKWSLSDCIDNPARDEMLRQHATRLRPIHCGSNTIGLAAISVAQRTNNAGEAGRTTAGFLPITLASGSCPFIVGFIETGPESARRASKPCDITLPHIQSWASEQLRLLSEMKLTDAEKWIAAAGLAQFRQDCRQLAKLVVFINGTGYFLSFDETISLLRTMPIAIYKSKWGDFAETLNPSTTFEDAAVIRPAEGWNWLNFDSNGFPACDCSIIDFIHRTAAEKGIQVNWRTKKDVGTINIVGSVDVVIGDVDRGTREAERMDPISKLDSFGSGVWIT